MNRILTHYGVLEVPCEYSFVGIAVHNGEIKRRSYSRSSEGIKRNLRLFLKSPKYQVFIYAVRSDGN